MWFLNASDIAVLMTDKTVELVLSKFAISFPFTVLSINRGLSDSVVYKVRSSDGVFALKSYNPSSFSSLQNAHAFLDQIRKNKFVLFPLIIRNKDNATVVYHDGFCWDLSFWVPGNIPDYSVFNLVQCVNKLVQFHIAAGFEQSGFGIMPAMECREFEINSFSISAINFSAIGFLPLFNLIELLKWTRQEVGSLLGSLNPSVKIQCCWGDARRENILFSGSEITGFIDYCAMRRDCREVDVSRMISSFAGDDYLMWTKALNAYAESSPINYLVCRKLDILGTIVSLYRWLKWFQNPMPDAMVNPGIQRCTDIFRRVEKWKEHGSLKSMLFYN
jgi:Ser/Thr protein kinase RdoA (MazF antagonist)